MLSNIYSVTTIYGLAILPMVVLLISPIQKFLLKKMGSDTSYVYPMPLQVWLIFMSDLGQSIFEQVLLWASVVLFLLSFATSIAMLANKSSSHELN